MKRWTSSYPSWNIFQFSLCLCKSRMPEPRD